MAVFCHGKRFARLARIGVFRDKVRNEFVFGVSLEERLNKGLEVCHIMPDWLRYAYIAASIDRVFPYTTHGEFHRLVFTFGVVVGILCPHCLFYDVTHAFWKSTPMHRPSLLRPTLFQTC